MTTKSILTQLLITAAPGTILADKVNTWVKLADDRVRFIGDREMVNVRTGVIESVHAAVESIDLDTHRIGTP